MKEFKYVIKDAQGIHARPAGVLVKAAAGFPCEIKIAKGEKTVNAKGVLGIMGLGVKCGEEITVTFDGEQEEEAYAAITDILTTSL